MKYNVTLFSLRICPAAAMICCPKRGGVLNFAKQIAVYVHALSGGVGRVGGVKPVDYVVVEMVSL